MLMDLMVVITYIKPYDKRIGEKIIFQTSRKTLI